MKTNRETSLRTTETPSSLAAFFRPNMRCGIFAILMLLLAALQLQPFAPTAFAEFSAGGKNGDAQPWNLQVDRVDAGGVSLEPSFRDAIYENLLEELAKTEQFEQLFRGGDHNASDVPGLLILKTTVQKYTPGSETRRAVTTVSGATKLNVRIQVFTREGHLVVEHSVEGDVRFIGDNLRATHNLAHNVATTLKRSTIPHPVLLVPEQETGKTSK